MIRTFLAEILSASSDRHKEIIKRKNQAEKS
jgi:hypothetical protein